MPKKNFSDISEIFKKYFKLKKAILEYTKKELESLPDDYRDFLTLDNEIKNIVMTGKEVLDVVEESISGKINELEEKLKKYKEAGEDLKKIVRGYQGNFVDELKNILEKLK